MITPVYQFSLTVPESALDANGHVNNVEYVRWMQEAAIAHSDAAGCSAATRVLGASWVARSHHVEYLRPAFAGEEVVVSTWISTMRRARSLRKYLFVRTADRCILARGETDWVFVDGKSGRPRSIPPEISVKFEIVPPEKEPKE